MATDLETEETEEQQEKCQWVRKWKVKLQLLKDYHESRNIFLPNLPERGGCSHMGYLESCISEPGAGFFIKLFKTWQLELEKQSQGIEHSVMSACRKLQTLEQMYGVKLSSLNNIHAEYLVEVFKYPGTGNCIPTDAEDGFGSMPMIGLYGLVEPYSIMCITTTQSGVMTKNGKKNSMSKCYCLLYGYVVQNHPSINNHFCAHLRLSLLCTIYRCFILNMAAMTCGFTLAGSTVYPLPMWQCHHRGSLRSQRSESPIESQWHSVCELNAFPRSAWWMSSLDVPYSFSCSQCRVDRMYYSIRP